MKENELILKLVAIIVLPSAVTFLVTNGTELLFGVLGFPIQIAILIIALRGLRQINLMTEQNVITRQSVAVDELRQFQKWVIKINRLNNEIEAIIPQNKWNFFEMKDFNFTEGASEKFKPKMSEEYIFFKNHKDLKSEGIEYANELEAIATSFIKGVADLSVVEGSMCSTFCFFVERYASLYVMTRNESNKNYMYNNTIKLYKRLKSLLGTRKEQEDRFIKESKIIFEKK